MVGGGGGSGGGNEEKEESAYELHCKWRDNCMHTKTKQWGGPWGADVCEDCN